MFLTGGGGWYPNAHYEVTNDENTWITVVDVTQNHHAKGAYSFDISTWLKKEKRSKVGILQTVLKLTSVIDN